MTREQTPVELLPLAKKRFGMKAGKVANVSKDSLPSIIQWCRGQGVSLLVARCATDDLPTAQAMEQEGFLLMDTLVYSSRDLLDDPVPQDNGPAVIRAAKRDEAQRIEKIAGDTFRGFSGHWHADQRLDNATCDDIYSEWAYRTCLSQEPQCPVLVAELDQEIAGFATMRLNDPTEGEGVLSGVAPAFRRRGVHRSLMIGRLRWFQEHGAERMVISTQITNIAAQRSWLRVGFKPSHAVYTFHKWFD